MSCMGTILNPGFCGCCDGKRGKRGHRGHRGHEGPAGPSTGALVGRQVFDVAVTTTYVPTAGTRKAIVRGSGGGGGGGGVAATIGGVAAVASGGNSGVAIEVEISSPPNTLLTGGPLTVGVAGLGGVGGASGGVGGDSTLVIGGVTLTAPGGFGGLTNIPSVGPVIVPPSAQSPVAGVDYSASDLGDVGIQFAPAGDALHGGGGGSGSYGIGGVGNAGNAGGNGAGGGGASQGPAGPAVDGGNGAPGIWIVEEYT